MASNRRVRRRDKVVARETDKFLASRRTERADDVLADLPQRAGRVPQDECGLLNKTGSIASQSKMSSPHQALYPSPSSLPSKHARNRAQEVWTR